MQKVNLNLIPGSVRPVINVSQYDEGRQFQLAVYDGATSYSLTGKTVSINGTKADGHGFSYNASDSVHGTAVVAISNNIVTITTPQQMTAAAGECLTELEIVDTSSNIVHTLNFILMVEQAALGDNTIISDTEIPAIIDAANANANRAEAAVEHYPYINTTNKHWMVWDAEHSQWSDTGVKAEGVDGASDYSLLSNKPSINNTTLSGNKSLSDLGIPTAYGDLSGQPSINSVTLSGNKTAADLGLATDAAMTGASSGTAGAKGLVPAPAAGDEAKFLRGDGSWANGGGGGATTLSDLTDTSISTPTTAQPLTYDSANSKWKNGGVIPTANGGTGNADGYIRTGQKSGTNIGYYATAEGYNTTASGISSHAEGSACVASGASGAHAEGEYTTASGDSAHAEGSNTEASGNFAHAGGKTTLAAYDYQTAIGVHNKNESDSLFEIGNDNTYSGRSNAIAVKKDGRIIKGLSDAFAAASNLGPVEMTRTMASQHAAGSFLFVAADDQFYQVGSTALTVGATLTPGTNATARSIADVLTSLNSDLTNKTVVNAAIASEFSTYIDAAQSSIICVKRDDGICVLSGNFVVTQAISSAAKKALFYNIVAPVNNPNDNMWVSALELNTNKIRWLQLSGAYLARNYSEFPVSGYVLQPTTYFWK